MSTRNETLEATPAGAPEKLVSRDALLVEVVVDCEELAKVINEQKDGGRASAGIIAQLTQVLDRNREIARTAICAKSRFCLSDSFVFRSQGDAVVVTRETVGDPALASDANIAAAIN